MSRISKNKMRPKVVGVDFDGTLCQIYAFKRPYMPKRIIKEKPNAEVVRVCRNLAKCGVKVVIYSSRWWGDYHWIQEWLDKYRVPYHDIVLGKFKADAFIDDTTVNPHLNRVWESDIKKIIDIA